MSGGAETGPLPAIDVLLRTGKIRRFTARDVESVLDQGIALVGALEECLSVLPDGLPGSMYTRARERGRAAISGPLHERKAEVVAALAYAREEADRLRAEAASARAEAAVAHTRAKQDERDWYDAKSEFGEAMAKAAEKTRAAESSRDRALATVLDPTGGDR